MRRPRSPPRRQCQQKRLLRRGRTDNLVGMAWLGEFGASRRRRVLARCQRVLWVRCAVRLRHVGPMALRLQMTPVKREKGRDLLFNKLFNWGSFAFGRWQVQVLGGSMVFYGSVCRVMWPLMMRLAQVTCIYSLTVRSASLALQLSNKNTPPLPAKVRPYIYNTQTTIQKRVHHNHYHHTKAHQWCTKSRAQQQRAPI